MQQTLPTPTGLAARPLAPAPAAASLREQEDLFALLDHELRTPLAALEASLDVLERVAPGEPEARYAMGVARRQAQRAAALLDGLLEIRRMLAAGPVGGQPVDLHAVVHLVVQALGSRNRLDPAQVELDCCEDQAAAEPKALCLVTAGMLSGAAKTWPGEPLRVSTRRAGDAVVMSVAPAPDGARQCAPAPVPAGAEFDPHLAQIGATLGIHTLHRVAALLGGVLREPADARDPYLLTIGGTGLYTAAPAKAE